MIAIVTAEDINASSLSKLDKDIERSDLIERVIYEQSDIVIYIPRLGSKSGMKYKILKTRYTIRDTHEKINQLIQSLNR